MKQSWGPLSSVFPLSKARVHKKKQQIGCIEGLFSMGLMDRDYMKSGYYDKRRKTSRASLRKRIGFFFWRLRRALFRTRK